MFYALLVVRMALRKIQSMHSCLIYCWGAILYQCEYKLVNVARNDCIDCNIRKCIVSGWRCYSISNLKFVLFFDLFLLCHGDIESNQAPRKSSNCQPLKFVIVTSIAYYQKIVLKYLSWNLSMICITLTLYVFSKCSYFIQWAPRMVVFLKVH